MAKQTVAEKRDGEKLLVSEMIALYCRKNHHTAKSSLCPQCQALHDYALQRIERCPFMETKTFCSACKVHCYKPEMREQIRTVMRWSGPRMLFVHPVLAVRHMKETMKELAKRAQRWMNQTLCAFLCGESQKNAVGGEYDSPAKKREIFAAN